MNIPIVVEKLKELSQWLKDSEQNRAGIDTIIDELEKGHLTEIRIQQLKLQLSTKVLFNPKCLGDIYIPDFDGTNFEWMNYIDEVSKICQENL